MLWHALKLAKLGLSVIPIKPNSKEPLYPWEEFQTRQATEAEITKWWSVAQNANIGIVTGKISKLTVIDCDGATGIVKANTLNFLTNTTVITGSGGQHRWFRDPDGRRSTNLWKGKNPHEEVSIRSNGNYIIAPPSIHPTGKRYRWVQNCRGLLLNFPNELLNETKIQSLIPTKQETWIDESLEDFKNGHVSNTLVSILGKFRAHNFSETATFSFLQPHNTSGKLSEEELRSKISEIWGRYEPIQTASLAVHRDIEADESVEDFLREEEPTEWFIDGVFAKNTIAFFAGLPESGKTWALMDLAINVATGGNWLGLFPAKKSKVLFIDQERARPETKRRFEFLFKEKGLVSGDLDSLRIKRGSSIKIDLESSYNAFVKLLDQRKPELVIIDSLATFHNREGNNMAEIQSVMEKLKTLRDQFKCTFLFVHHLNKNEFAHAKEGQEPDIGLLAGSIAIPAAAETVFIVRKRLSGESTVYHCKSTMAKKINPFEFSVLDTPKGIAVKGLK